MLPAPAPTASCGVRSNGCSAITKLRNLPEFAAQAERIVARMKVREEEMARDLAAILKIRRYDVEE
jgi:hypothetical protein